MIELVGVGKRFGGARALREVSLRFERGECHALLGENGAGKSTLGRLLAGVHAPDEGELRVEGRRVRFRSPADALAAGIAMVPQEPAVCAGLSVAENVALGRWPRRARTRLVDRRAMEREAARLLDGLGASLDPRAPVGDLSVAQRQLVQIAAALGRGARLLVLDEPTSALAEAEARRLREVVAALRARGVTVVYVGHRLSEVVALADRLSVLRDGRLVATLDRGEQARPEDLVRLMLGRVGTAGVPRGARSGAVPGEAALAVEGLASPGRFHELSFRVRRGEIVGLAGLLGSGRSAVLAALFGLDRRARGRVLVAGAPLRLGSARRAMAAGLALLPEDRQRQGLVASLGARANWSLPFLGRFRRRWGAGAAAAARTGGLALPLVDRGAERRAAREALAEADLRAASLDAALEAPVAALSGGNQQKLLLARCLSSGAPVLLVDEPTRGVDVGAKAAIQARLAARAAEGAAILLASSDLEELLALGDRLLVLREGRLVADLPGGASEEAVLQAMAGG